MAKFMQLVSVNKNINFEFINLFVGYGAGGRLGIGGSDSVLVPTLLESIQHIFIKKVAVSSGGKHCLALSADNDVYSWGEGDDGKLGHGTRT